MLQVYNRSSNLGCASLWKQLRQAVLDLKKYGVKTVVVIVKINAYTIGKA